MLNFPEIIFIAKPSPSKAALLLCSVLLLFSTAMFAVSFSHEVWAMGERRDIQNKKPACHLAPPRQVIIGGHTFQFPPYGELFINSKEEIPCDYITHAMSVLYYPPIFLGKTGAIDGKGFVLGFGISKVEDGKPSNTYLKRVSKILKDRNVLIKNLPREGDFYVFQQSPNQYWYISRKKSLQFSPGSPLVFECLGGENNSEKKCYAGAILRDNLVFDISDFSTLFFPPEQFGELFTEASKYLKSLEVAQTEENKKAKELE